MYTLGKVQLESGNGASWEEQSQGFRLGDTI